MLGRRDPGCGRGSLEAASEGVPLCDESIGRGAADERPVQGMPSSSAGAWIAAPAVEAVPEDSEADGDDMRSLQVGAGGLREEARAVAPLGEVGEGLVAADEAPEDTVDDAFLQRPYHVKHLLRAYRIAGARGRRSKRDLMRDRLPRHDMYCSVCVMFARGHWASPTEAARKLTAKGLQVTICASSIYLDT